MPFLQRRHFLRREMSPSAFRQLAQRHRSDGYPQQTQYLEAQRCQQSADVAVAAFVQRDFEPGVALTLTQQLDATCA